MLRTTQVDRAVPCAMLSERLRRLLASSAERSIHYEREISAGNVCSKQCVLGVRAGEYRRIAYSQFSEERRSRCRMEAAEEVRSFSGSFEWRRYRHIARLSLQLDRGLSPDEARERGPCAMHGYGGICHQIVAADSHERFRFSFCESYRSNR